MTPPSTPQAQQPGPSRIVTAVQTGLSYDVEALSPTSLKNVKDGLCNGRMSMVRCYERDDDFHFELQERICVKIPDGEDLSCSTCPYDEGRACRHIRWVGDQILSTRFSPEERSRYRFKMSREGHAVLPARNQQPIHFYAWLEESGLHNLAQLGGWWKQDPSDQHDTRLVEQTATHILSTFEPCGVLTSQHGQDNLQMLQQESQALFTRYKNEMIKQVKSQPFLLVALGAAVPEAERDFLHLTKIHSRIERIFFDYGYWMAMRTPSDGNLDATAEALYVEIGHLHSFFQAHRELAPNLQVRIVGILLYTLEQLVEHAGDIQTTAVVSIPQYSGLSLQDRSLLHKLINSETRDSFVLPALRLLKNDFLRVEIIQGRAMALADKLRGGNEPCPERYVQMLEQIVGLRG